MLINIIPFLSGGDMFNLNLRGGPLPIFFAKAKLGDYEFNGGIPKSRKGLVWPKIAFEIWGNPNNNSTIIPPF